MSKKLYYIVAMAILIGMAGFVGAQVSGTKPAAGRVLAAKEKAKKLTVEERIINLTKNQEKILAELKAIKENQTQILAQTQKIFLRMKRK
ncbi:hypothetical protein HQ563_11745 [bacterium]|nr:hypothetical protein [bacterium]